MSKSIWEILSPFTSSASQNEEAKEDPAEDAEEKPVEEAEEKPAEETEEKPAEDAAEKPAEEAEEKPAEETILEPLLFRVIHKLMSYKIVMDLCKFIMMIFLGIILVLTYGQIRKSESCASFETIFAQFEANKLCNYFIKGDMDKLTEQVHILTPVDGYKKDWENDLREQTANALSSIFQEAKLGKLAKKNNITCEYQKDKVTGITHLVYTCYIQITSKEEMKLIFQKDGKKNFQISAVSHGKNTDTFEKMTAHFTYLSNGYYSASDYEICSLLNQTNATNYSNLSVYFHKDANKNSKKDTLGKEFVSKLTALLSNKVTLTNAVFTPYEYNKKTKQLSTCLIMCFRDHHTNASGILYQTFTVGIYGYAPNDTGKLYTDSMDETVALQIQNLFSQSNAEEL